MTAAPHSAGLRADHATSAAPAGAGWATVAGQECRDLWLGGRGPVLLFAFSVLLSLITYLSATNQVLNFLEQRETVNLILQVAVAVGALVTLIVSADAISGERERGTLESLLLTPVSRRGIVLGKLTAAMSLWLAAWLVSAPYAWVLGRGVDVVGPGASPGPPRRHAARSGAGLRRAADQRSGRFQQGQPRDQPLPPSRAVRAHAVADWRPAGLAR